MTEGCRSTPCPEGVQCGLHAASKAAYFLPRAEGFPPSIHQRYCSHYMEFMSSMMQKISLWERKIDKQALEIQMKDKRIAELEEMMKAFQKGKDAPDSSTAEDLETRCLQLQTQVWEMEGFPNDYGLIWVRVRHEEPEDLESEMMSGWQRVNQPDEAVISKRQIDFDLILENVRSLNVLAGDGVSHVEHVPGGAWLRQPEALPLTLYQNGIIMFDGPFCSYEEPSARQCLQDIMDGYFPSELQAHYTDGVCLQERDLPGNFPGHGRVVGHSKLSKVGEPTEIPGPKPFLEEFWNKYSKFSMHREAIATRDTVRAMRQLQDFDGVRSSKEIMVGISRLAAPQRYRLEATEEADASAPEVCTLRIKSESGEQMYVIKMLFSETIGDLRRHLACARGGDSNSYEIISTFPQRVYMNESRSLQ